VADSGRLSPSAAAVAAEVAARLPSNPLVVALSGGADSGVAAWAVRHYTDRVRAVSVDHGQPSSGALMAAANDIAAALDLPHEVVVADPAPNSETALRDTRYRALRKAVGRDGVIVTGHTLDDQAETVVGNVIRGAGTPGLRGIPRSGNGLIRPLLDVRRDTIRAIAVELDLPFIDDPQNEDLSIRRNRLRRETLPHLAEFNPGVVDALGRLASHAGADDDLLRLRAERVPIRLRNGAVVVPAACLSTLPSVVATRVVRSAMRMVRPPYPGVATEIAAVLDAVDGRSVTIGGGVQVSREGPWLVLVAEEVPVPAPTPLHAESEVHFDDWVLTAGPVAPAVGRYSVAVVASDRMLVRAAESDERISIGSGSKRVGVAMAEAGVPPRLRARWPTLAIDDAVVWIPGVRSAPPPSDGSLITVRARRLR
jgi:tRNA(Ile)-lysidine synthase